LITTMMLALAGVALQPMSVVPAISEKSIAKALAKATPIARCTVGVDCDAKWKRARKWVLNNSRFTLVLDTDQAILTHPAIYANTDASYAVVLDPPENGIRAIRFRAWCGNWVACIPSPQSLRIMFSQAMADVSPQ
jgi:hypothetical protein